MSPDEKKYIDFRFDSLEERLDRQAGYRCSDVVEVKTRFDEFQKSEKRIHVLWGLAVSAFAVILRYVKIDI